MPAHDVDLLPLIRDTQAATDHCQEQSQVAVASVLNARPNITASDPWPSCSASGLWNAMVAEIDIWRSAQQMVDQFGDHAPIECSIRADMFLEQGDFAGQAVWCKIAAAAEELLKDRPDGSVH